jgi:hypothetical protein
MRKIVSFYTKKRLLIFEILIIVFVGLLFWRLKANKVSYPELSYIASANFQSSDELESYFKNLALDKGSKYAFEVLKVAALPSFVDTHILGHTVGNVLYKEKGVEGMKDCTDDFRNACSHSIVVGFFVEKGIDSLPEISKTCREAPGGKGAYTMCFHGLGHGILAFTGYDFAATMSLCRKTGSEEFGFAESAECVGGAMMEMVAGVHDKDAWERSRKIYFKEDDPLYPCNQGFVPSNGKHNCFLYLTPHLWEAAGVENIEEATDEQISRSIKFCGLLTGDHEEFRSSCYAGFGKEFVVLSGGTHDIRDIGNLNTESLEKIVRWCRLAEDPEGIRVCFLESVNSLYWGGENKPDAVIKFCSLMNVGEERDLCFGHLIGAQKFYQGRSSRGFCKLLPEEYKKQCYGQK